MLTSEQYSIEVSKVLYSSIKISNFNLKKTKENFVSRVNNHENDVVRNTANFLSSNEQFNDIFENKSLPNARSSSDEVGGLNLNNVQSEINSSGISSSVRKKII